MQNGHFRKSAVRVSKLFLGNHERSLERYFEGNIPHPWRFQSFKEIKKYNSGGMLQNGELNLVLRKTAPERYCLQLGRFRKSTIRISIFFREIMQDKSNIIFMIMFYIDERLNN